MADEKEMELWKLVNKAINKSIEIFGDVFAKDVTRDLLDNDVVHVVRCKDCERRKKSADLTNSVWCMWYGTDMPKDGFCSYGERRVGE